MSCVASPGPKQNPVWQALHFNKISKPTRTFEKGEHSGKTLMHDKRAAKGPSKSNAAHTMRGRKWHSGARRAVACSPGAHSGAVAASTIRGSCYMACKAHAFVLTEDHCKKFVDLFDIDRNGVAASAGELKQIS